MSKVDEYRKECLPYRQWVEVGGGRQVYMNNYAANRVAELADAAIAELEAEKDKWEWVATHYRGWDFDGIDKIGDRREQSKRNGDYDEVEWLLARWAEREKP